MCHLCQHRLMLASTCDEHAASVSTRGPVCAPCMARVRRLGCTWRKYHKLRNDASSVSLSRGHFTQQIWQLTLA